MTIIGKLHIPSILFSKKKSLNNNIVDMLIYTTCGKYEVTKKQHRKSLSTALKGVKEMKTYNTKNESRNNRFNLKSKL